MVNMQLRICMLLLRKMCVNQVHDFRAGIPQTAIILPCLVVKLQLVVVCNTKQVRETMPLSHGLSGSHIWIGQLVPIYPSLMHKPFTCPYSHPFSTRPGPLMAFILGGSKRGPFHVVAIKQLFAYSMLSSGADLGSRTLCENKRNYFLCRCKCGPQSPAENSDSCSGFSSWAS